MKKLDEYKLKIIKENFLKALKIFILSFSISTVSLFILITCFTFWTSQLANLLLLGYDISILTSKMNFMFGMVILSVIIIVLNILYKLKSKWEK